MQLVLILIQALHFSFSWFVLPKHVQSSKQCLILIPPLFFLNLKSTREPNFSFHNGNTKSLDQSMDPFVKVYVGDDMMVVACHQNWVSSLSREPTLADSSTGCSTSMPYSRDLQLRTDESCWISGT